MGDVLRREVNFFCFKETTKFFFQSSEWMSGCTSNSYHVFHTAVKDDAVTPRITNVK